MKRSQELSNVFVDCIFALKLTETQASHKIPHSSRHWWKWLPGTDAVRRNSSVLQHHHNTASRRWFTKLLTYQQTKGLKKTLRMIQSNFNLLVGHFKWTLQSNARDSTTLAWLRNWKIDCLWSKNARGNEAISA